MDPLLAIVAGLGGVAVGAGIHQHGVDAGAQWVRQYELPQERLAAYTLGRQHERQEWEQRTRYLEDRVQRLEAIVAKSVNPQATELEKVLTRFEARMALAIPAPWVSPSNGYPGNN